ncbi:hypothetical protein LOK49_LG08G02033 [Camellia lanceoleosa]|uniref:Uncharacterized protein n=1 Tax=Camellia lanceoleosa TaxID=1840588 RepID=A0ACC0GPA1_9ERIC|nr:hypothetical protein LOK49_LG08G02033 [Camellia lanceoleosa]
MVDTFSSSCLLVSPSTFTAAVNDASDVVGTSSEGGYVENGAVGDIEKPGLIAGAASLSRDGLHHPSKQASSDISGEGNEYDSSNLDLEPAAEPCPEKNERSDEIRDDRCLLTNRNLSSHLGLVASCGRKSEYGESLW